MSATSEHPDFRVSAVQLILALVATTTRGGSVDFRVPLIGMQLRAGATVSRQDTHSLDLMLVPPGLPGPESATAMSTAGADNRHHAGRLRSWPQAGPGLSAHHPPNASVHPQRGRYLA